MSIKILYGITFPIWFFATSLMTIIATSFIIHNNYDTKSCYDGLYINLNMYDLFLAQLITYITICFIQIIFYILVKCDIAAEKAWWILINNIISFIGINIVNGLYLNFILTNTNNCFENIKITNTYIYIYFIITFIFSCILELILMMKVTFYSCLN